MEHSLTRTEMLLGEGAIKRLKKARVAVFGMGGVGGYAAEALARSGIGALDLIDHDRVSLTNLNRQIYALHSTIGQFKTEVAKERIKDINPECSVACHQVFFSPETAHLFSFAEYDYIIDAIDTVTGKIQLVEQAKETGTPIICSMGAGNKLDATQFQVADISKTTVCPLARVMRRELKVRNIKDVKVVYSTEEAVKTGTSLPGSVAWVPSVAGLILAGEVIKDLCKEVTE